MAAPAHLTPFSPVRVGDVELAHTSVPEAQILDGSPTTGAVELGRVGGARFGVWEMSVGGMRDIEVDEFFVVLSGEATVTLARPDERSEEIRLTAGSACRLTAGSATEWNVSETLRKVYVIAAS